MVPGSRGIVLFCASRGDDHDDVAAMLKISRAEVEAILTGGDGHHVTRPDVTCRDLLAREGAPLEPAPDRIGTDPQHGRRLAHGDRRSPVAGLSMARRPCRAAYPGSGL